MINFASNLVVHGHSGMGHSLHDGSHGLFRRRYHAFLAGNRKPALIAINIDIGEPDSGDGRALRVHECCQTANVTEIAEDVRRELAQNIFPGTASGDLRQGFGTVVNGSIRINILKFVRQDASHGTGVAQFECSCPGLFDLHQDLGFLSLVTGTVCGLGW